MINLPAEPPTTSFVPQFFFRLLNRADGAAYRSLRLQSLEKDGAAFMSTFDAESRLHDSSFSNHLEWAYRPPLLGYYGIFSNENTAADNLLGYAQLSKTFLAKQNHITYLYNLYIHPDWRGRGAAQALLQHIFDQVQADPQVERVLLSCTAQNKRARRFYEKMGFQRSGVKVKAIKWQDQYDDEVEYVWVATNS